ncbi:MAG: AraC family transcriptional regulator [Ignavibacteriaceae bacterium]|nr:AraC family transcriptional regulator [Ignavibacteriaceae bacterium]MCW8813632.1 AraC family transcriptional regulator [Chlorobium sp.]MCW8816853.1 AraC family transcriptional regulator [Ignavibacteriaceae bacterium]MCW8824137.1 AraC family transcriptional regulator [Ignavibacteriaceae bacterium]MCW8961802.1 AraC family transcriptional regulator [Ignavibacteriaceae bacterium]
MNRTLLDSLAILTAILLLIFSAFALTYKKGNTTSHKILTAFLLANALFIIDFALTAIIEATGFDLSWFNGIGTSFGFLFGPLLFLYTKSITKKEFSFEISYLLHLIVFVIFFISALFKIEINYIYLYSALYLQTTPYMIVCFETILKYRRTIKNYFSSIEKLNLTWMLYVVGAFFVMWMVDLSDFILANLKLSSHSVNIYFAFVSLLINFIFAILIFYKALQHPEIFSGMPEAERPVKYEQSRLTDSEKVEYLQKLRDYFEEEKPYLNPELTITEVARKLNVSVKYLSQVINESLGKNFYDFINSYRIEEAKQQLKNETDSRKTILEVLYESGFNSKSAFNSAFKKHTGFTPTEFRKQPLIN